MPRVNRDLQRRLEARRERERRRPTGERRYRFTPSVPPSEAEPNGTLAEPATEARPRTSEQPERLARTSARPAPRPYSAYAQAYAYVLSDLRRVALIYGGLLLALVILFLATQR